MKQAVRTRIAPSPTGFPHIGTIYQVLFDYAFAKKHHGKFILRLEDTDRNRFVQGAEEVIYETLAWFGLQPDEDPVSGGPFAPYRQSERLPIYKKYADELITKGLAYYCFCTRERLEVMRQEQEAKKLPPMYDKRCLQLSPEEVSQKLAAHESHVVRMKIPENRKIIVEDVISGTIEFDSSVIDHQVLMKSDGFPTYHLGVVVDDHLMEISHIFRGKEWISSTPKHVLLYEYFGWDIPVHGHLPLILNADGKGKLSKRHGHASVEYYQKEGFLPEAVLNYLSNIVWNHPQGKEIYPLEEFINLLDITKVTSQGARFDVVKLEWMNGEYIRALSDAQLYVRLQPFLQRGVDAQLVRQLIPLAKERMKKLTEFSLYLKPFISFTKPVLEEKYQPFVAQFKNLYETVENWTHHELEHQSKELVAAQNLKMRDAFMAVRLAVTGEKIGLPLFETLAILGKAEVLQRMST